MNERKEKIMQEWKEWIMSKESNQFQLFIMDMRLEEGEKFVIEADSFGTLPIYTKQEGKTTEESE